MSKTILIVFFSAFGLFTLVFIHIYLLRFVWYQWIAGSIYYPIARFKLKRQLRKMDEMQVVSTFIHVMNSDIWQHDFWFINKMKAIISRKIVKKN